jgi:hypothetical protein
MQLNSASGPVNRADKYDLFVGRHSVNVADVVAALTGAGVRHSDGAVWVRDRFDDEACRALTEAGQIETLRQAAGMALLESRQVAWVVATDDPTQALAWAAEDLIAASSTGRKSRLFVVEAGQSGTLLRALAELTGHWAGCSVEVTPLAELPSRVVAFCKAGGAA